ncbi:MAG: bactofilin family protein, partial [Geminicoccales bacterium]
MVECRAIQPVWAQPQTTQTKVAMPSLRADRDGPTVVSAGMHISGNLISDCDVQIDGCVEGDVQSPRLVITEQGSVLGSVYAAEVD